MAALRGLSLRSVLLTSGTLSPLESFAHELQLGFKYTLENPHVINPNQVRSGGGSRGETRKKDYSRRAIFNSTRWHEVLGEVPNKAPLICQGQVQPEQEVVSMSACCQPQGTGLGSPQSYGWL